MYTQGYTTKSIKGGRLMVMNNVTVHFIDAIVTAIRDKNVDFDRRVNLWATVMCSATN